MKALPLEILQNLLMGIGPIAKYARSYHSTGLDAEPQMVRKVFEFYSRFVSVEGKDILEIGPGQTIEVLENALAAGAGTCTAVDIADYISLAQAREKQVTYAIYDGKKLPFESKSFDVVWSYTAFEHLRYPALTVAECFRVLREGGKMVVLIDLGDHSFYGTGKSQPLELFHCLQYPGWLWRLMKWNRSSYVNRLRKSDWKYLFVEVGFVIRKEESRVSDEIEKALPSLQYLHRFSQDDAVTCALTLCVEKPVTS